MSAQGSLVDTAEITTRRYTLGKHESRSVLGGREKGEVGVLVAGVLLGVGAAALGGGSVSSFAFLTLTVLMAVAIVFLPFRGRTLYRWLPVDARFRRAQRRGTARYVNVEREAGTTADGEPVDVPAPPVVGRIKWISVPYQGERMAVCAQLDDGGLTAVLEVEGPGVGLYDGPEQQAAVERWGIVLRDLANADGFLSRLSLLERTVPADPEAHARYVAERGDRTCPPALIASYDELQGRVSTVTEQHRNYIVLRMSGDRYLSKAIKLAGGGDAGLGAVMAREVDAVISRLEDAAFKVIGALSPAQLSSLIASLYDPDHAIDDLHAMSPRSAWPRTAISTRDALIANDEWHHATAWIKTWPMVSVGVNFLAPLLVQTPGVIRTVAVTEQLIPTDVAMSKALADLTHDEADASRAAKQGRVNDPRRLHQSARVDQRASDLASGAGGVRLVGYVTVSARGAEELEAVKRRVRTAAAQSWLTLEWCDREHDRAFVNTLPFARGLR